MDVNVSKKEESNFSSNKEYLKMQLNQICTKIQDIFVIMRNQMRIFSSTCLPKYHRTNLTSEIKQESEIKCTEIRESHYT